MHKSLEIYSISLISLPKMLLLGREWLAFICGCETIADLLTALLLALTPGGPNARNVSSLWVILGHFSSECGGSVDSLEYTFLGDKQKSHREGVIRFHLCPKAILTGVFSGFGSQTLPKIAFGAI
jgi:hypothetical protein